MNQYGYAIYRRQKSSVQRFLSGKKDTQTGPTAVPVQLNCLVKTKQLKFGSKMTSIEKYRVQTDVSIRSLLYDDLWMISKLQTV